MRILSVTSVRDEGPYLLEWIAHHQGAGISDFLIFSNDCSDGTAQMLDVLQDSGIVTHVPQEKFENKSVQWQALQQAWKHPLRKQADWVLVSDVDEFLNIHTGNHTIPALLRAVQEETDAIVLPWRLFGHSGVVDLHDAPVTQQFTRCAPADLTFPIATGLFKTLLSTKGPFNQLGVHRPRQKSSDRAGLPVMVDGSGALLPDDMIANSKRLSLFGLRPGRALAEINHYAIRSAAAFMMKRARGLPNRTSKPVDLTYWAERNFNTETNDSILAMRNATDQKMQGLLALPGLRDLHIHAVAWHQTRFAELISDPEEQHLFTRLLLAGSSEVLPPDVQAKLIQMYRVANSG